MVFSPNTGSVVVRSSQGRFFCFYVSWLKKGAFLSQFLKTTGSVVVRSSQRRFCFLFFTCPGSTNVIFGHFWTRRFEECWYLVWFCNISSYFSKHYTRQLQLNNKNIWIPLDDQSINPEGFLNKSRAWQETPIAKWSHGHVDLSRIFYLIQISQVRTI